MFVDVAIEGEKISILCHKDFNWEEVKEAQFPNYMQIKKKGSPIKLSKEAWDRAQIESEGDAHLAAQRTYAKMVKLQAKIIAEMCPALHPRLKETQTELQTVNKQLSELSVRTKTFYDLDTNEDVTRSLNLPFIEEEVVRPKHTPETCEHYPEFADYGVEYNGCSFHQSCMIGYLKEQIAQTMAIPICPKCKLHPLPETVLDLVPDIKAQCMNWKSISVAIYNHHMARRVRTGQQSLDLQEISATLPQLICSYCQNHFESQDW